MPICKPSSGRPAVAVALTLAFAAPAALAKIGINVLLDQAPTALLADLDRYGKVRDVMAPIRA